MKFLLLALLIMTITNANAGIYNCTGRSVSVILNQEDQQLDFSDGKQTVKVSNVHISSMFETIAVGNTQNPFSTYTLKIQDAKTPMTATLVIFNKGLPRTIPNLNCSFN